jgi:hypothetical protein
LNKKNNPKISISNSDLTDAESQALPYSGVVTDEQAGYVCRTIQREPGKSK